MDGDHRRHDHLQGQPTESVFRAGEFSKYSDTQKKKLALRYGTEIGCSSEPPGIRRAIVMRKNEEEPLWSEKKRSAAPIG